MNKLTHVCLLLLLSFTALQAQDIVQKWDIDGDGKQDYVELDSTLLKIVCKLSTQKFQPLYSLELENYGNRDYIQLNNTGFCYHNNWMRAGYSCYFDYDANEKRIRVTSMSRYEFGNATNDGSGESGVDLLSGDYIGSWNYFDYETEELIAIPTIECEMTFQPIFLEGFSDETYFDFGDKCSQLYYWYRGIDIESRERDVVTP